MTSPMTPEAVTEAIRLRRMLEAWMRAEKEVLILTSPTTLIDQILITKAQSNIRNITRILNSEGEA